MNRYTNKSALTQLKTTEKARLTELEAIVDKGQKIFVEVGLALAEIRDKRLYKEHFTSFDDYCQTRWGWSRIRGFQLIEAAKVVKSLPESVNKSVNSEAAARALSKIPTRNRVAVIEAAKNKSGQASGASIKRHTPPSKDIVMDKTGIEVPPEILDLWNRGIGNEVSNFFTHLSATIRWLQKSADVDDILFAEVGKGMNNLIAKFINARSELELIIPHAVCPSCNGVLEVSKCPTCKGRGFLSKFYWRTCVPDETRKMREGK